MYSYSNVLPEFQQHPWSNGMIIAFQAVDPGSTPGGCNFLFLPKITYYYNYLNSDFFIKIKKYENILNI